jgi:hypothetical protein
MGCAGSVPRLPTNSALYTYKHVGTLVIATAGTAPRFLVAPDKRERSTHVKHWFKGAAPHVQYLGADFPSNPLRFHNK